MFLRSVDKVLGLDTFLLKPTTGRRLNQVRRVNKLEYILWLKSVFIKTKSVVLGMDEVLRLGKCGLWQPSVRHLSLLLNDPHRMANTAHFMVLRIRTKYNSSISPYLWSSTLHS